MPKFFISAPSILYTKGNWLFRKVFGLHGGNLFVNFNLLMLWLHIGLPLSHLQRLMIYFVVLQPIYYFYISQNDLLSVDNQNSIDIYFLFTSIKLDEFEMFTSASKSLKTKISSSFDQIQICRKRKSTFFLLSKLFNRL